ncbi:MAG: DUF169 domain-containing protein [Gammaproteobacteria bacterium]|nr:DUF169 domain-containing protein [Gammaproteobacteria bacterium]
MKQTYAKLSAALIEHLKLSTPPLAISFVDQAPADAPRIGGDMPEPTEDGRTGAVSAGCVFWMKAAHATFSTTAADHANCNVGSLTHGFRTLEEAATGADVAALVESGWVSPEMFPHIPVVAPGHRAVVYGPLAETTIDPDVVFLRISAKQAMVLSDALGGELAFEGKPQCHIIPMAKNGTPAISVGCMLSRVRTGMPNHEMTCALPAARLADIAMRLADTCAVDGTVAAYAAADKARFD